MDTCQLCVVVVMRFWGATQGGRNRTGVAVKGVIDALPQGQWEAAAALGLG
jgi:hypothetical protein